MLKRHYGITVRQEQAVRSAVREKVDPFIRLASIRLEA